MLPACSEGILWHVLTSPLKISQSLLTKYTEAVGDTYCPDKKKGIPVDSEIVTEAGAKQQVFQKPKPDARKWTVDCQPVQCTQSPCFPHSVTVPAPLHGPLENQ
jgi:hypothetical protein